MPRKPIIIVEDDDVIAELIEYNLQNAGFETCRYAAAEAFFQDLPLRMTPGIAMFILDVMLPDKDGFEICRILRADSAFDLVPIMMLTARGAERDKVRGIETGADDYLTKPFGIRELLSRVRGLIRRYGKISLARSGRLEKNDRSEPESLAAGELIVDDRRRRVYCEGEEVELTNREYELLKFLISNRGFSFTRDELLNHVWGYEYAGETRTVDVHIRHLRRKLGDEGGCADMIETIRGYGYRFAEP